MSQDKRWLTCLRRYSVSPPGSDANRTKNLSNPRTKSSKPEMP